MKGLVGLSKCEWITYLTCIEKDAPPVFEAVTYRSRNWHANGSTIAPHKDCYLSAEMLIVLIHFNVWTYLNPRTTEFNNSFIIYGIDFCSLTWQHYYFNMFYIRCYTNVLIVYFTAIIERIQHLAVIFNKRYIILSCYWLKTVIVYVVHILKR